MLAQPRPDGLGGLHKAHFTDCRNNLARTYSRTRANGCVTVLRELVDLAVDQKWLPKGNDLMEDCKWAKAKNGKLKRRFPAAAQWAALRGEIVRRLSDALHWIRRLDARGLAAEPGGTVRYHNRPRSEHHL